MLLFGKILKFQSLAPGQRSLHRSERLAITTGATGMHGIGETRDARITIAAVDGRSYGINRVRRGFGSRRASTSTASSEKSDISSAPGARYFESTSPPFNA